MFSIAVVTWLINVLNVAPQKRYLRSLRLQRNWKKMPIPLPTVLPAHTGHVVTCLEMDERFIVSASDDHTVLVWDAVKGTVSR